MNLMTIENVTKTFGEKKIFDNIIFGIDFGDKVGLIGINGAGKSTLLKLVGRRGHSRFGSDYKNERTENRLSSPNA